MLKSDNYPRTGLPVACCIIYRYCISLLTPICRYCIGLLTPICRYPIFLKKCLKCAKTWKMWRKFFEKNYIINCCKGWALLLVRYHSPILWLLIPIIGISINELQQMILVSVLVLLKESGIAHPGTFHPFMFKMANWQVMKTITELLLLLLLIDR